MDWLIVDYFVLFGLERKYDINLIELTKSYMLLQAEHHPDNGGVLEISARINEAYGVLSDPFDRGRYLLELCGKSLDELSSYSAESFFYLREKYSCIESYDEKCRFKEELSKQLDVLASDLLKVDYMSDEFANVLTESYLIKSFLEKIRSEIGYRY